MLAEAKLIEALIGMIKVRARSAASPFANSDYAIFTINAP